MTGTVALEERLRTRRPTALTGLPNGRCWRSGSSAVAGPPRRASRYRAHARLRELNEHLGLHLGDQLLVEIGRRLVREVRGAAVVSRLGGDEFAVLTLKCTSVGEARERAAAVREVLSRPFDVNGELVECRTDIGVALAPAHAEDGRGLLRAAQDALDVAKRDGSGYAVYEPSGRRRSAASLLAELRQGLANQDLELHYQPVVDLRTGRVAKVEAVLRWQADSAPSRLPLEFLELAEQSGLIRPLTRWVVGEVARAARHLAELSSPLVVAADLSASNLLDTEVEAFLTHLIGSGELPVDLVEVELAETELMDDPGRSEEAIARLHGAGLRFVVDEFGTGYTSLSTMQRVRRAQDRRQLRLGDHRDRRTRRSSARPSSWRTRSGWSSPPTASPTWRRCRCSPRSGATWPRARTCPGRSPSTSCHAASRSWKRRCGAGSARSTRRRWRGGRRTGSVRWRRRRSARTRRARAPDQRRGGLGTRHAVAAVDDEERHARDALLVGHARPRTASA